ncbi:major facilitator superfamily transporter [Ceratobasidium sp. AG-Ba]|nr:major facilitator superfamily transporter [Ceratobasidium sp. AG-Ba]
MTLAPFRDLGRVRTLAGCVLVALASGTNYVYSAYAPQLGKHLNLSNTQVNIIGIAGNIGVYFFAPVSGYIVDRRGPRIPLFVAAAFLFLGYGGIRFLFTHASPEQSSSHSAWPLTPLVAILSLCSWLTGVAGSAGIISAMNAGVKSFPEKLHASVTGTTNSAFGLSAFFFSFLARELFPGRTTSFLMVLVFGTTVPVLAGALVIKTPPSMVGRIRLPADDNETRVPGDEDLQARAGGEDPEAVQDELRDVLRDGVRVPAEEVPLRSGDESVLYGERNPWASQAQTPAGQTPKSSVGGPAEQDIHGLGLFKVVDFWIIFGIVGLLAGPGLMYINNVGSIVQALYAKNGDGEWNEGAVQAVQASQVGLLSVSSFVGRLGVGFIADYINHSHTVPRTSCLIVSSIFGIVAESMLARVETTAGLSAVSGVLGISYGTTFALFPALVLERFGLAHFAQNAGLMGIAAALFGNVFNYGFGRNFDAHSGGSPAGGATDAGNMQCYNGRGCYVDAVYVALGSSCMGLVLSCVATWRSWKRGRNGQVQI